MGKREQLNAYMGKFGEMGFWYKFIRRYGGLNLDGFYQSQFFEELKD
jgi:hypothetical protein